MVDSESARDGLGDDSAPSPWVESVDSPVQCPHCGRPFAADDRLALHIGVEHGDRLSESERVRYERASAADRAAVRRHKLFVLFALTAAYFGFLFVYAIVT